jgi:hypothetical protein
MFYWADVFKSRYVTSVIDLNSTHKCELWAVVIKHYNLLLLLLLLLLVIDNGKLLGLISND